MPKQATWMYSCVSRRKGASRGRIEAPLAGAKASRIEASLLNESARRDGIEAFRGLFGFEEAQRVAIGFADSQVFVAVHIA